MYLYAEYIMQNARLDEAQAGIKISGRNINNLRYADDTTLMAESKEELKSHLMKVKEESENTGLKLNIQKTEICVTKHTQHTSHAGFCLWASLVAQRVKSLPSMQETLNRSLGGEDLLEKEMATHSRILAWEILWTEEPGRL